VDVSDEIERAIEVFVRGFAIGKSVTHPYLCERIHGLWLMRDAPRNSPRDYRKEEWIAYNVEPRQVDATARRHTRGRFFIGAMHAVGSPHDEQAESDLRSAYKLLGYRLLSTEPLFVHRLMRILRAKSRTVIRRVNTAALAERFAKATRTRPIRAEWLRDDAPFRQYAALVSDELVGWVRSVNAAGATWCSSMYVRPAHRRRGIGSALLVRMLRDDRASGSRQSVLLSSQSGALIYPRVGYEQIGQLLIFAPRKT
jgi:GNAT superfamily N-acetyltransferase